ncbi:MAG TPA: response regulator transcription factor [Caldilineae bacterium]|nr:response regulator transcription factor [Caldilineae bacterium]
MIRIFLADDHDIVRHGLISLFDAQADMHVVGETRYGQQVLRRLRQLKPDVLVLDLKMPDLPGLELIRQVREIFSPIKIIVYSMYSETPYVARALRAGACGYVTKDVSPSELVRAVRTAIDGQQTIVGGDLDQESILEDIRCTEAPQSPATLTPRQRETAIYWALGHTTIEIAQAMHVQPRTVEKHKEHIRKRLGLRTQVEVLQYAMREGLVIIVPENGLPEVD